MKTKIETPLAREFIGYAMEFEHCTYGKPEHFLKVMKHNTGFIGGLTKYGNVLYYNTDKEIWSYDTVTKKETKILTLYGSCGIFADKNILKYSKYDKTTKNIVYDNEIILEKEEEGPIIGSSIHVGDKIITPIHKEDETPIFVFCRGNQENKTILIDEKGTFSVESDEGDIFFWTDKLKPLSKKHHVE